MKTLARKHRAERRPAIRLISTLCLAVVAAVTAQAAQTSGTALCDGFAAAIRGNRGVVSGAADPLSTLSSGNRAPIQLSRSVMEMSWSDKVESMTRFRARFDPSDALAKAVSNGLDGAAAVLSLPGSDAHVIESVGGTAHCSTFVFFRTSTGRQSQLLPSLPPKGDHDGDNLICEADGGAGYLARIDGTDVFLDVWQRRVLRVVPLRTGQWGAACTVDARFRTLYDVSKVFVPNGGPVGEVELRSVAGLIVEQREAAGDAKAFTFGPRVPEAQQESVRVMTALVANLKTETVPAFGHEKERSDALNGSDALGSGDSFPLVLNGRAYLMRIGRAEWGCCYSSGPIVVLYSLKDGKLDAVGSAFIEKKRGPLELVTVAASR